MQKTKKRICIIKLDGIGDVLRTTPILRRLRGAEVTWVTHDFSVPVLAGNPFIKTVLPVSRIKDSRELEFDELYNFDEDHTACLLAMKIGAQKKKGYGLKDGAYFPFDADSRFAYELSKNDELKFKLNKKTYQQVIFGMAGFQWDGEDYILGYKPKGALRYEVGINYLVGKKFPNKAWPHWRKLAVMLDSVSLQKKFEHIKGYIDWINSCRIIVTGDSLGMHIALALKKKVIVLMGSTSWNEIETYGRAVIVKAKLSCSPCYKKSKCCISPSCMEEITSKKVYSEIMKLEDCNT